MCGLHLLHNIPPFNKHYRQIGVKYKLASNGIISSIIEHLVGFIFQILFFWDQIIFL